MGSAVKMRTDFSAAELRRLAKASKRPSRRLLSLAAVREGRSREEAAKGGMDRQTLRDWVHRFIASIGVAMGLGDPPRISPDRHAHSYITVIKRNWHLLPYDQLVELLGWGPEWLARTLREDDFLFLKLGIREAGTAAELIVWDGGWKDSWVLDVIQLQPDGSSLMSVSEWQIPLQRGGVTTEVGEYSVSIVGPGPRARRHGEAARRRGLKILGKIQANTSWELAAVPYLPVVENVAPHAESRRD